MLPEEVAAPESLFTVASRLLGRKPEAISPAASGRNSRIYRVQSGSESYALKCYPQTPGDTRRREEAETAALRFFALSGISCVPLLIASQAGYALLSWVEGEVAAAPLEGEIAQAAAFIAAIKAHAPEAGTLAIGRASECCLSPADIDAQVATRLANLKVASEKEPALSEFLRSRFLPLWKARREAVLRAYAARGLAVDTPIKRQCLSPADFGFHNALRRDDGALTFIDFEYFGWDDPARLAAEFCLHPGQRLEPAQQQDFRSRMEAIFADDALFCFRRDALTPLFALRWALIMLNAFLPEYWQARAPSESWEAVKERQLAKADTMLMKAKEN